MEILKKIKVDKYTLLGKTRKGQLHIGCEEGTDVQWVKIKDMIYSLGKSDRKVLQSIARPFGRI